MKTELLLITLLWAVTLNGFSVAINARGPARVTLSYFLAILCLCAAVFHSIQYGLAQKEVHASVIEAPVAPPVVPEADIVKPTQVDTADLHASKMAIALGAARNELTQIIEQGRRLAERLSAVDLSRIPDLSDAEYDAMQNKSFGFRNEVGKIKERLTALAPTLPEPYQPLQPRMQAAVNELTQAVQAYDRFFKAENDQEESVRQKAFQSSTQNALAALKQAEAGLSSP